MTARQFVSTSPAVISFITRRLKNHRVRSERRLQQTANVQPSRFADFCRKTFLRVSVRWLANPLYIDSLLAFAGLSDVVGDLHPHERVHLYAEGFLDAERHVSGKVGFAVE
jgi:hypothetical protein